MCIYKKNEFLYNQIRDTFKVVQLIFRSAFKMILIIFYITN